MEQNQNRSTRPRLPGSLMDASLTPFSKVYCTTTVLGIPNPELRSPGIFRQIGAPIHFISGRKQNGATVTPLPQTTFWPPGSERYCRRQPQNTPTSSSRFETQKLLTKGP